MCKQSHVTKYVFDWMVLTNLANITIQNVLSKKKHVTKRCCSAQLRTFYSAPISRSPRFKLARSPRRNRRRTDSLAVFRWTIFFSLIQRFTASSSIQVDIAFTFILLARTSLAIWQTKWNFGLSLYKNCFLWTASAARDTYVLTMMAPNVSRFCSSKGVSK